MSGKTSTASKAKYNAKAYDRINVVVPKGRKKEIQEHAKKLGLSLNSYIVKVIDFDIESDK
jgi:predicted HicB family RNase H-like nuclease